MGKKWPALFLILNALLDSSILLKSFFVGSFWFVQKGRASEHHSFVFLTRFNHSRPHKIRPYSRNPSLDMSKTSLKHSFFVFWYSARFGHAVSVERKSELLYAIRYPYRHYSYNVFKYLVNYVRSKDTVQIIPSHRNKVKIRQED